MLKILFSFKKNYFFSWKLRYVFFNFFLKKNNWFFLYKSFFFFKFFIISNPLISFFWNIPSKKKNKNKRIKFNFFFFQKTFYQLVFKILKKKKQPNVLQTRFYFINRFFFIFFKREWLFLKNKRSSLSLFIRRRKMRVNTQVLKSKFIIRKSFFFKKKNKQLFNYNLGFSILDF